MGWIALTGSGDQEFGVWWDLIDPEGKTVPAAAVVRAGERFCHVLSFLEKCLLEGFEIAAELSTPDHGQCHRWRDSLKRLPRIGHSALVRKWHAKKVEDGPTEAIPMKRITLAILHLPGTGVLRPGRRQIPVL